MSERALVIFGDFDHFRRSAIAKLAGKTFTATPAGRSLAGAKTTAFLKWAPRHDHGISTAEYARVPPGARIINDTHFSADKKNVHRHMQKVFGYSSAVVPLLHVGPGVIKSNQNARHDGRVVEFPIKRLVDGDVVYERLIRNQFDAEVCDIRIPHVLGQVPFAYKKYRPVGARFSNQNSRAELVDAQSVLSEEEIAQCIMFAASIGLQYGELDVLRDRNDGRIYVIDANNTPYGPPNGLPENEVERALSLYAETLIATFFCDRPAAPL